MIVVFGSINVDLVMEMDEVPARGQTILVRSFRTEPGGKGANQALAARRAGAEVTMVGAVGNDALAAVATGNLLDAGVDVSRVITVTGSTGCASVWLEADGANRIGVALGANAEARAGQIDDGVLAKASSVLLQMENRPDEIATMIRRCRSLGVRSILNLAPAARLPDIGACGLLVVNEDEAAALAGWIGSQPGAVSLRAVIGCDVIRTLGSQGSEAATANGTWTVPAFAARVRDTTAAGDCYVGVLAAALDRGLAVPDAMREASAAAALACERAGSQASLPTGAVIAMRLTEGATLTPSAMPEDSSVSD
ncbi:MAG: ribokinase [Proteobacteria bacterium]|nr:ribokinase [Pseudomonadota bacterium]